MVGNAHAQKDIALHFKVMLPSKQLVLNTMQKGKWGVEETKSDYFPFKHGQTFDLAIACEAEQFNVSIRHRAIWTQVNEVLHYHHTGPFVL